MNTSITIENKKYFMSCLQTLFTKIDDLATSDKINSVEYNDIALLCKELYESKRLIKETVIYTSFEKSIKRKQMEPKKTELAKLQDDEYMRCQYCDKLIKSTYIEKHEEAIVCYRQRQTKRNVFNVKHLYNEKYGKYQALNLCLKDKHVDFKDLFIPSHILKALCFETKNELLR